MGLGEKLSAFGLKKGLEKKSNEDLKDSLKVQYTSDGKESGLSIGKRYMDQLDTIVKMQGASDEKLARIAEIVKAAKKDLEEENN